MVNRILINTSVTSVYGEAIDTKLEIKIREKFKVLFDFKYDGCHISRLF